MEIYDKGRQSLFPQVGGRITGADEKTSLIEIHSVTDWI
jgi:hypothetical protein